MKFKKTLTIAVIAIAVLTTGYIYVDNQIKVIELSAMGVTHKDLGELEERSELIVTGVPIESENHVIMQENGIVEEGFTITSFKVEGVYEDKSGKQLNKGDIIKVAEPMYTVDNGVMPGQTQFIIEDYKPMQKSGRYILVLKPDVNYPELNVIVGADEGQYRLDDTVKGLIASNSKTDKFKKELISKYNIK
jgi:hypothetical protein